MNSKSDTAPAEAAQIDIYPCPFCGQSQRNGPSHDEENCFFPLSERLKSATGADAFHLSKKVSEAWCKRFVPPGYKVISTDCPTDSRNAALSDIRRCLQDKDAAGQVRYHISDWNVGEVIYPIVFKHLKSLYEPVDSRPTNDA